MVGGFGLGDGLEGTIDERDGCVPVRFPVGGLSLGWDSRGVGEDRFGLGNGWGFGLGFVDVRDGVRVFPSSGGVFEVDASHPSGLSGYGVEDLCSDKFRVRCWRHDRMGWWVSKKLGLCCVNLVG